MCLLGGSDSDKTNTKKRKVQSLQQDTGILGILGEKAFGRYRGHTIKMLSCKDLITQFSCFGHNMCIVLSIVVSYRCA